MRLTQRPALVYCEGAYLGLNGKTAHGLVRFTRRYEIRGVIDSTLAGQDAGDILDGKFRSIPIYASIQEGLSHNPDLKNLVIGLAPDGGKLPEGDLSQLVDALEKGINIDSGLHTFLGDIPALAGAAQKGSAVINDIRKPPAREDLHFFSGKIEEVDSIKLAVLGSDSAIGKRTSSWLLLDALIRQGLKAELVGTGQTAWMQGARFSIVLDSLINDFVAGEIEHAVWSAWKHAGPDVIIIEGQGSLLHPAYPGGFEIIGAARPELILFQHAPARIEYDGFPGYKIHDLEQQLEAIRIISGKKVAGICINREKLSDSELLSVCREIEAETGIPAVDPLGGGMERIADIVKQHVNNRGSESI